MLTIMGSAVCPHCYGSGTSYGEATVACRLCEGARRIGQTKQEAVRYGKALAQARIEQRVAAAFASVAFSIETNGEQYTWHDLENGYVPLIDWPSSAIKLAEAYMRNSAHTH